VLKPGIKQAGVSGAFKAQRGLQATLRISGNDTDAWGETFVMNIRVNWRTAWTAGMQTIYALLDTAFINPYAIRCRNAG